MQTFRLGLAFTGLAVIAGLIGLSAIGFAILTVVEALP